MSKADAPNYRDTSSTTEFCSNCRYASQKTATGGHCDLYNFTYLKGHVCDSWKPKMQAKKLKTMVEIGQ